MTRTGIRQAAFALLLTVACTAGGVHAQSYDYNAGEKYAGETKNDVPHGKGKMIWSDGRRYDGEWKYGDRHGKGTYRWPGGEVYSGHWRNNRWHGQGTYTRSDGTVMKGEWKNGNMWNIDSTSPDGTREVWKKGIPQ